MARRTLVFAALFAALAAATLASLAFGAVKVPLREVLDILFGGGGSPTDQQIVETLRLPRTVEALLVGAALGIAGAVLQGALGNPLASPDVIGVTGGAGFGAILIIILLPGSIALLPLVALARPQPRRPRRRPARRPGQPLRPRASSSPSPSSSPPSLPWT